MSEYSSIGTFPKKTKPAKKKAKKAKPSAKKKKGGRGC